LYDKHAGGLSASQAASIASHEILAAEAERAEVLQLIAYKARVADILDEFFVSQDFDEALRSFREMSPPSLRPEIAKRILMLSLDRSDTDRELASRLLSACYGDVLTMMHIGKGFTMLFAVGSELETDSPDAVHTLARFLARAVVDEILPPAFLMDPGVAAAGGPVVVEARAVLSAPRAAARLEHVWGAAAAAGVAELKEQVRMAVQELFDAGSLAELERCVKDLEAPSFHHEVVKRVVVVAVGREERERTIATDALAHLGPAGVGLVSESQAERGLRRVVAELGDLKLDTPAAETYVSDMIATLRRFSVVAEDADLTASAGGTIGAPPAAAAASAEGAAEA